LILCVFRVVSAWKRMVALESEEILKLHEVDFTIIEAVL
jgi:hypothetical protein